MLASPTTVTIDGTAHSLSKVNQDNYSSVYRKIGTGETWDLTIRHQTENAKLGAVKVDRHNADLKYTKFAVDGTPTIFQAYVVLRTPQGADPTIIEKMSVGLLTWFTSNDGALIAWES